jgi:hypothetical protein
MVENHEAKLSTYGKLLLKKEKLSWEALKIALDVEELVRTMIGSPWYSWNNQRNELKWLMAKLDRVYISNMFFEG